MKKFALLTTPFLCMSAIALHADSLGEISKVDSEYTQSSQMIGDSSGQYNARPAAKNGSVKQGDSREMRDITPQAPPQVTNWADPYLTAEFIYWKAYEENIHYAYTGAISTTTANASEGRVKSPDFGFEPGFKLGFGLKFNHDGWDLYGNWTWLNEFDGHSHVGSGANSVAHGAYHTVTTASPGVLGDLTANTFHTDWTMHFNALDLELGRNFYISPRLTLRPHFGLKFGWVNQNYHVKMSDFSVLEGVTGLIPPSAASVKMEQDFFGVGLRTGLDTVWYFAKHWGLYADFAFAALWSSFDTHRTDHLAGIDAVTTLEVAKVQNLHVKRDLNTLTEVLELGMGFRYDTTFFLGDYDFYIQAGWEEQIWFNQNQFLDTVDTRTGNLTFQGLTVKTGIMF